MRLSTEIVHEIWNDDTGERMIVRPDLDGLNLIEVRNLDNTGNILQTLTFTVEQAQFLIDAIACVARDIRDKEEAERLAKEEAEDKE